jgi:hypothetical protein
MEPVLLDMPAMPDFEEEKVDEKDDDQDQDKD